MVKGNYWPKQTEKFYWPKQTEKFKNIVTNQYAAKTHFPNFQFHRDKSINSFGQEMYKKYKMD